MALISGSSYQRIEDSPNSGPAPLSDDGAVASTRVISPCSVGNGETRSRSVPTTRSTRAPSRLRPPRPVYAAEPLQPSVPPTAAAFDVALGAMRVTPESPSRPRAPPVNDSVPATI